MDWKGQTFCRIFTVSSRVWLALLCSVAALLGPHPLASFRILLGLWVWSQSQNHAYPVYFLTWFAFRFCSLETVVGVFLSELPFLVYSCTTNLHLPDSESQREGRRVVLICAFWNRSAVLGTGSRRKGRAVIIEVVYKIEGKGRVPGWRVHKESSTLDLWFL